MIPRPLRGLWVTCICLLLVATARAESTGTQLRGVCDAPRPEYCWGYVNGVVDAYVKMVLLDNIKRSVWCFPKNYTVKQGTLVLKKWLEDNPDKLHLPARDIVSLAFIEAFECKR